MERCVNCFFRCMSLLSTGTAPCRHVALSMRGQVQIAAQTPPLAYLSVWTGSWGTSRNPPKQSWFNNAEPPVSRTFCQVCVPNVLVYARQAIICIIWLLSHRSQQPSAYLA
eukprot:1136501-Pelagomonas_calceolata.AAC.1